MGPPAGDSATADLDELYQAHSARLVAQLYAYTQDLGHDADRGAGGPGPAARLANALIDVTPVFGDVCPVGRLQFQDGRHRDPLTDAELTMSATASGDVERDGLVDEAGIC